MLSSLLGAGLSGAAGADANAGAFWAQNQALNNEAGDAKHTADAAGSGGVGGAIVTWLNNTYGDPVGSLKNWGNQLLWLLSSTYGQTPPADANPPGDVTGGNGRTPPTAGAVVTPLPCPVGPGACGMVVTPVVTPGSGISSNLMLSSGGSDSGSDGTNGRSSTNNAGFDTSNLESKLNGYLLDSAHPQNQTKANWFSQALGFNQKNWQDLAKQLYFDSATAVPTKATPYGQTYEQVIPIKGGNGKTIDTTFVFMKDKSGTVRLVTGIPSKK
ncbi:tRNA nuclease CdiA-2 [Pandoraea anapnoica]|uniref:tRNA nuclease CdiA-2 n=2 Tax=Pandoraea anapnoica TaxID=2508301 RepID=A0A5E5AV46_9BURK|nr:tRNA nuclease CdiA-2 [Pandoraea anapnoica]